MFLDEKEMEKIESESNGINGMDGFLIAKSMRGN